MLCPSFSSFSNFIQFHSVLYITKDYNCISEKNPATMNSFGSCDTLC